jgi:CubicO group peptidase (beta-lactamase class C family)
MADIGGRLSRRTLLRAASATAVSAVGATVLRSPASAAPSAPAGARGLFRELDDKIRAGMTKYAIPGVAVGVWYRGTEYVRGYGVTNVDHPKPVTGDTVFRVASTTKTFTGTVLMRLVELGKLDLDAPVARYLPEFRTADAAVARKATVRQVLNHSAGWLGDCFQDTGEDADALTRYVASLARAPQLTEPGAVFSYNNAAFALAGRLIEVITGFPYEMAVRIMLIDPLGLDHSRYFDHELGEFSVAMSHNVVGGKPVVEPEAFRIWRSLNAVGGLISSARDQLRYARFHLGDSSAPGARRPLLSPKSLLAMRSRPGPGGTLFVELDGVGVSWTLRPSAQGVRIVQHGGDWTGQHSGFLMVPERDFALTLLTNSEGGPGLVGELFSDDWALRRFAGLSNLPAVTSSLSERDLVGYAGNYVQQQIGPDGQLVAGQIEVAPSNGRLLVSLGGTPVAQLAFYRPDYVVMLGPNGEEGTTTRADFVRGSGGQVEWLRVGGRLMRRQLPSEVQITPLVATARLNPLQPLLL